MSGGKVFFNRNVPDALWFDIPTFRLWDLIVRRAVFGEGGCDVEGRLIKRGQYLRSTRKLREDLAYIENRQRKLYGKSTIERSLQKLEEMGLIELGADPGAGPGAELGALITICNYEDEQSFSTSKKRTSGGTSGGTRGGTRGKKDEGSNDEGSNDTPIVPKGDDPPAHLRRFKAPLKPRPHEESAAWMTDAKWDEFTDLVSEAAAAFLCEQLTLLRDNQPRKYTQYKCHFSTLKNWHQMKLSKGLVFFEHPLDGANYYPRYVIEKLMQEMKP